MRPRRRSSFSRSCDSRENTRRRFIIIGNYRTSETRSIFARSRPCEKAHGAGPSRKGQSPQCINTRRLIALRNNSSLTAGKGQYSAGQGTKAAGAKKQKAKSVHVGKTLPTGRS